MGIEIKEEKKALRKRMLTSRLALEDSLKSDYDRIICEQLIESVELINPRTVHAYIPIANEINIIPVINRLLDNGVRVVCPKTLPARKLENRVLKSLQDLETGIMGTKHPAEPEIYTGDYDLILVPGLAFDRQGFRLGYGGGYYDNFLNSNPASVHIGVFYPFQKVEKVPVEPHDVRLKNVITAEEILRFI